MKKTALILGLSLSFLFCYTSASAANYTVMPSDSLYKLGVLFQEPVNTIKADNKLSTDLIYPGQVLTVTAQCYTVKSGDTLYLISKRYAISIDSIRKANNKWDDYILPGQKLILPGIKPTTTESNPTLKAVIPYSQADVDLLARLITAETTNEPFTAMVGVGAVVINRVKNPDWPSTISAVINQVAGGYYQFTPVKNGYINNPASSDALKAAWAALYGSDSSNGAMFYFDDSSTNQWLWSKPVTVQIGHMVFVK
jgi:N-acetylmuramoyl-L-alanine amidase